MPDPKTPITVDHGDLWLLLRRVEPLMKQLTAHDNSDPVIGAIDRLGDAVCAITQRLFLEKEAEERRNLVCSDCGPKALCERHGGKG